MNAQGVFILKQPLGKAHICLSTQLLLSPPLRSNRTPVNQIILQYTHPPIFAKEANKRD